MSFNVIIPARLDSTRLPEKVLAKIAGKPMLQHVYQNAIKSGADRVIVATDSAKVVAAAEKFAADVCLTSADHESGTERLAEVVAAKSIEPDEVVICLQADEPLLPAGVIRAVAQDLLGNDALKVSTACQRIDNARELFDPSIVKVVFNHRHYVSYFSRAPIPWQRDRFSMSDGVVGELEGDFYRHIGIYGYRAEFLQTYVEWSSAPTERAESLEQLRILWNGGRIHMVVCKEEVHPGVDTREDLERVKAYMKVAK